jgi:NAD(P)-dependent dehydrogenase (short-subunit alcohol dehydrogenase family)
VIVTGGNSGIGAATAVQFGREGAQVVIAARRPDKSEAVVSQIKEVGGQALFVKTDVSKRVKIQALVEETFTRFWQAGLRGQ